MNLADYRITYNLADWERIAKTSGELCAPIGAVRAVNALCDEVERQQAVIAELVGAAINLRKVAGRYHTEQAFKSLMDVVAKHEAKPG